MTKTFEDDSKNTNSGDMAKAKTAALATDLPDEKHDNEPDSERQSTPTDKTAKGSHGHAPDKSQATSLGKSTMAKPAVSTANLAGIRPRPGKQSQTAEETKESHKDKRANEPSKHVGPKGKAKSKPEQPVHRHHIKWDSANTLSYEQTVMCDDLLQKLADLNALDAARFVDPFMTDVKGGGGMGQLRSAF